MYKIIAMKTISIGRDESCDIVITDRTNVVSRRHAVITIDNSGKMTITDYSSNGTYVNGIKMSENVAVPITRKDNISFAHVFELDWNMVPNVRSRNIKIILGSAIAVIAIITLIILLGDDKPKPVQPETEKVVVDTMSKMQPKVIAPPMEEKPKDNVKEQDIPNISDKNKNKSNNNKNVDTLPKSEQQDKNKNKDKDKDKEASVEDVVVDPIIF